MATLKPLKVLEPYKEVLEKPVWGPVFWAVFHKKAKQGFTKQWLKRFSNSIMCPDCKEHFEELLIRFPIEIFDNHEVYAWILHNMVNTERANKPYFSWSEYMRKYKDE
jgi:hypothetical protein